MSDTRVHAAVSPRCLHRCLAWVLLALMSVVTRVHSADPAPATPSKAPSRLYAVDGFPDWVASVAWSSDGTRLAAGSYESVRLLDAQDGKERATLPMGSGFARSLVFRPHDGLLLCGTYRDIELWDPQSAQRVGVLSGHRGYVTDLEISPDGATLASTSEDGTLLLWDLEKREQIRKITIGREPVLDGAFSRNGDLVATVAGDETRLTRPGTVTIWSAQTGDLVRELPSHTRAATAVLFSRDSDLLLSAGIDEQVHIVDAVTGELKETYAGHSRPVNCLLLTAGDRIAISGSGGRFKEKNEIRFWNPADLVEWGVLADHAGKVTDLALSPDGRRLASASYDKTVLVWDITPVWEVAGVDPPAAVPSPRQADHDEKSSPSTETPLIRVGIIGLDTSHVIGFTKLLNATPPAPELAGCRVVAAYPQGSPDIESSVSRVPAYTEQIQKLGVAIVPSIAELLDQVDAVLLETNDGRPHLEQVLPVLRAGMPVFVDKPIAGSLADAVAIIEAAKALDIPLFSASVMRFQPDVQNVRGGAIGEVLGGDTFSPCSLEATHPDLFWYGIHGVEALFTVMGPGCESVARTSTPDYELVVGTWTGGRIGTFRGMRAGKSAFGGTAFGSKQVLTLNRETGYEPLVAAIVTFFRTLRGASLCGRNAGDSMLSWRPPMRAIAEGAKRSVWRRCSSLVRRKAAETLKALDLGGDVR